MSLKCSYIYEGESYTRPEIVKKIRDENLHIKGNKMAAEKWLKEKLGNDQVVQWVSTLIDGKAFGQFTKDGTILLSELFERGTEYHEAFHRVWQTFLNKSERQTILNELEGVNLDGVRKLYPKLSEQKLKEEYLAEAFREYVLNDGNILFPEKTQTFFQRLLEFLNKLFGKKKLDMRELFQKINEGAYRNAKVSYPVVITPMNRIADFDIDESSELVRAIATKFLNKLFVTDNSFQAFVKNRIPIPVLRDMLFNLDKASAFRKVLEELAQTNQVKAVKMLDNHFLIQKEIEKYLKNFRIQIDEWEDAQDELGHKDSINDKPAFLSDDKSRFSELIKLLLASIPSNTKSTKLGLTVNSDWSNLSSKLAKKLSGKAISTTNLFRELDAMSNVNPEFKTLLDILGGTNEKFYEEFTKHPAYVNVTNGIKVIDEDATKANGGEVVYLSPDRIHPMMDKFNLRQAFHNAFTKHYYEFYVTGIKQDGTIYTFNADIDAKEKAITNQFKNKIQSDWQQIEQWIKDDKKSGITSLYEAYKSYKYVGRELFGNENHLIDFNLANPTGIVRGREAQDYIGSIGLYFEDKRNGLKEFEGDKDPFQAFYGQISNWLNNAAKAELEVKVETELAINNIDGNKVFPVNLHTFQTILIDSLNYYATMKEDLLDLEIADLLEEGLVSSDDANVSSEKEKRTLVIKARMPYLFNAYTQNSIWLNRILEGGEVPIMTIYDGLSPDNDIDGKALADVDPTDLFSTFMAGLYSKDGEGLNVVYPAFKHSDRSVMYGYKIEKRDDSIEVKEVIEEQFVKAYKGYIQDQIGLRRAYESNKSLYKTVAHFNPHDKNLLPEVDEKGIMKLFEEQKFKLKQELDRNGNLRELNGKPVGINKELWEATLGNYSNKNRTYEQRLDDALAYIVKESFIGFMEQTKLFTGDPGFYSSASNFFKRMNTQSSTGNPGAVDKVTNTVVDFMNQVTKVYHGVEYGKIHNKKADGKIREIIGKEVGDYKSPVGDAIYNKYLEYGKKFNVTNPEEYAQRFRDAYDAINENDGQSYVNLFAWREFYTRIEGWNPALQKMFDIEMNILNGKTSEVFDEIFNEWLPMYVEKYKPKMTLEQYKANPGKVIEEYWSKFAEPFRVIKGQYMGPVYVKNNAGSNTEGDEMSRVFIPGIRKTSYMPLIPSMIIGTNLERLNKLMFDYGLDMFHMGSGAKVGTNSTIDIYDKEGNFVLDKTYVESLDGNFNSQYGSELDYRYMKNQVKISGKEKPEIIMATQARKNMLQNFKNEDGTWVDEKLAMEYIELHRQIVYKVLDEIDSVLNQDRKGFVQSIKKSLQDEPENVFNALQQLEEEGYIEQLPIRNKLENVLFSMIGKKGVKIKATGNAAIQAAVTMFESGSRKVKNKNTNVKVKENVDFVFKQNSRLSEIGTQEEYSNYLESIFPSSSYREIVFHGSRNKNLENFDKIFIGTTRSGGKSRLSFGEGFYFTPDKLAAKEYTEVDTNDGVEYDGKVYPVILNNPNLDLLPNGKPFQLVVSEPEDIYILGSAQDLDNFVKWKNLPKTSSGLEASTELKTYLDAEGNIQKAEIMLPLPQAWIPKLLKHYGTHDLFKAIENLNSEIAEDKWENHVTFKGLRIPNQQVSSNDIFKVKKFFLPTVSNMVVVPADIVVKTGSDFDVDKMNLYMPNLDTNFEYIAPTGDISQMSMEQLQNRLIQVDGEILLHQDNFYQTLATIDDGLLKDDIFKELQNSMDKSVYEVQNEGKKEKGFKNILKNINDFKDKKSMKFFDILNIPQQVQVKVNAVDSKIGVGVVATEITGHAMFQVNGVAVNKTIQVGDKVIETKVFSEGEDKYRLDSVYDTEGNLITENLSVILTSQVDAAKNDYAPRININKTTLPVLTYMIRRGESLKNTMMFLNQPIVHEYLRRLNVNNSLLYRTLDKKGKKIEESQLDNFQKRFYIEARDYYKKVYPDKSFEEIKTLAQERASKKIAEREGNNLRQSGEKILEDVRKAIPNKIVEGLGYEENLVQGANQHEMLQRFLDIKAQGDVMLAYKQGSSADTDVPKNMNAYENVKESAKKADESQLLIGADKVRTEGLLQPFFDVQRRFEELKKYYFMYNVPNFTELVNGVSKHIFKQDEKLKMLDIINSDFALYLIQNLPENKGKYEKLFTDASPKGNIGKRVLAAAKQYDNLFLKTLASKTKLSQQKDGKWKGIPAIQFIQPKDPFALNNMIEHFQSVELLDKELYDDLVMASLLQTSINPSPFSWLSVFPNQGYDIELFKKAFGKDNINPETLDFDNYLVAFFMNNPKYLPEKYQWDKLPEGSWFKMPPSDDLLGGRKMYRFKDSTTKHRMINLNGKEMEPFGTYHLKNYQASKPLNKSEVTKPTAKNDNSRNNDKLFDASLPKINIYAGTNENAELSNFAVRPFKLGDDITYPTVEHAFQLEKLQYAKGYTDEEISSNIERVNRGTASQAKAFGKTVKNLNVKEWDKDAYSIMKDLIRYSFNQNPKAKTALLNTGNSELTHIQDKSRWGKEFPLALMEVRKEFQMQEQDKSCTISGI